VDVLQILAGPVGRHRFVVEDFERLFAELADPLGFTFHLGDVVESLLVETVTGVIQVVFGIGEISPILIDFYGF